MSVNPGFMALAAFSEVERAAGAVGALAALGSPFRAPWVSLTTTSEGPVSLWT